MSIKLRGLRVSLTVAGIACLGACGSGTDSVFASSDKNEPAGAGSALACDDGRPPTLLSYTLQANPTGGSADATSAAKLLIDRSGRFDALDVDSVQVADGKHAKAKKVKFKDKKAKTPGNQAEFEAEVAAGGDWFVTSYEACQEVETIAPTEVSEP